MTHRVNAQVSPRAKDLYLHLKDMGATVERTQQELAFALEISHRQICRCLKELLDAGLITMFKRGLRNVYVIESNKE